MLVLTHADRLGIELHQFRQRVHEPAANGDRSAHGEVVVGKFFPRHIRRGIDGSAALVDHDHRDGGWEFERLDERLGLTARGAVADGDGLDLKFANHAQQRLRCFARLRPPRRRLGK